MKPFEKADQFKNNNSSNTVPPFGETYDLYGDKIFINERHPISFRACQ